MGTEGNQATEGTTDIEVNGVCGESLLQELPDDVFALISKALEPIDLCNMSLSCKRLNALLSSDKVWWQQCLQAADIETDRLQAWRSAVHSYKILCRFILGVKHLIGIWVHQNPELGNMVYVMWGFLSVVGCRIIPQELGPQGFESGLLWAPVFEVIGNSDGSLSFFLHGRERDKDYCYPGSLKPAKEDCNVLLLEVQPYRQSALEERQQEGNCSYPLNGASASGEPSLKRIGSTSDLTTMLQQKSKESDCSPFRSKETDSIQPRSNETHSIQFGRLGFGDRRRLLELVAHRVRLKVPPCASGPLFPSSWRSPPPELGNGSSLDKENVQKDLLLLYERRNLLIWMHKHGDPNGKKPFSGSHCDGIRSEIALKILCNVIEPLDSQASNDSTGLNSPKGKGILQGTDNSSPKWTSLNGRTGWEQTKKQSFARFLKERMKQIMGVGPSLQDVVKVSPSSSADSKRLQLQEFLRLGDTVGLCLHASSLKLAMYRAWPIMHDNRFALYKMPVQKPEKGREHAGLWGGTFGWPPGRPPVDKPGKALFFLLLSYEETEEGELLIATKILEGNHYVLHPNGSAMFTARVDEESLEKFPWENDRDATPIEIVRAYKGEGIANGYGFRYPGSKPGDLFVCQKGLLAFVWKESKAVLTLQRLDLPTLLRIGERVTTLPPVANFAYLTKSYSNVFAGYSGLTTAGSATRSKPTS